MMDAGCDAANANSVPFYVCVVAGDVGAFAGVVVFWLLLPLFLFLCFFLF